MFTFYVFHKCIRACIIAFMPTVIVLPGDCLRWPATVELLRVEADLAAAQAADFLSAEDAREAAVLLRPLVVRAVREVIAQTLDQVSADGSMRTSTRRNMVLGYLGVADLEASAKLAPQTYSAVSASATQSAFTPSTATQNTIALCAGAGFAPDSTPDSDAYPQKAAAVHMHVHGMQGRPLHVRPRPVELPCAWAAAAGYDTLIVTGHEAIACRVPVEEWDHDVWNYRRESYRDTFGCAGREIHGYDAVDIDREWNRDPARRDVVEHPERIRPSPLDVAAYNAHVCNATASVLLLDPSACIGRDPQPPAEGAVSASPPAAATAAAAEAAGASAVLGADVPRPSPLSARSLGGVVIVHQLQPSGWLRSVDVTDLRVWCSLLQQMTSVAELMRHDRLDRAPVVDELLRADLKLPPAATGRGWGMMSPLSPYMLAWDQATALSIEREVANRPADLGVWREARRKRFAARVRLPEHVARKEPLLAVWIPGGAHSDTPAYHEWRHVQYMTRRELQTASHWAGTGNCFGHSLLRRVVMDHDLRIKVATLHDCSGERDGLDDDVDVMWGPDARIGTVQAAREAAWTSAGPTETDPRIPAAPTVTGGHAPTVDSTPMPAPIAGPAPTAPAAPTASPAPTVTPAPAASCATAGPTAAPFSAPPTRPPTMDAFERWRSKMVGSKSEDKSGRHRDRDLNVAASLLAGRELRGPALVYCDDVGGMYSTHIERVVMLCFAMRESQRRVAPRPSRDIADDISSQRMQALESLMSSKRPGAKHTRAAVDGLARELHTILSAKISEAKRTPPRV